MIRLWMRSFHWGMLAGVVDSKWLAAGVGGLGVGGLPAEGVFEPLAVGVAPVL